MMRFYAPAGISQTTADALYQALPADPVALTPGTAVDVPMVDNQNYTLTVGATATTLTVSGGTPGMTCYVTADNSGGGSLTPDGGSALDTGTVRLVIHCTGTGTYDLAVVTAL